MNALQKVGDWLVEMAADVGLMLMLGLIRVLDWIFGVKEDDYL